MNAVAADLVDRVLPEVPIRQWVLSLPPPIRTLCAFRPEALSLAFTGFHRAISVYYRRKARSVGFEASKTGAVTVIQRFGSACELNPHFHSLFLDGVFIDEGGSRPTFLALDPPQPREIVNVVRAACRKIQRLLQRRGLLDDGVLDDGVLGDAALAEPDLADLFGETRRAARSPGARVVDPALARARPSSGFVASEAAFNLHAGVTVAGDDRTGRERLCRYLLRPPLSNRRLEWRGDGRLELRLKTPWQDGTVAHVLSPEQLVARLAVLIPRPAKNLVRYTGVLAPNSVWRRLVVPEGGCETGTPVVDVPKRSCRRAWLWADLLRRIFAVDVLECERCGGRMKLMAMLTDVREVQRYLDGLERARRRPTASARPPPAKQS